MKTANDFATPADYIAYLETVASMKETNGRKETPYSAGVRHLQSLILAEFGQDEVNKVIAMFQFAKAQSGKVNLGARETGTPYKVTIKAFGEAIEQWAYEPAMVKETEARLTIQPTPEGNKVTRDTRPEPVKRGKNTPASKVASEVPAQVLQPAPFDMGQLAGLIAGIVKDEVKNAMDELTAPMADRSQL